jgi:hypothetical protein
MSKPNKKSPLSGLSGGSNSTTVKGRISSINKIKVRTSKNILFTNMTETYPWQNRLY